MRDLKGKVAIVTGGASGIGRASALLLARSGCRVLLADRDQAGIDAVMKELRAIAPDRTDGLTMDVSDADQVAAAVRQTTARHGRLDILVHSAGIYPTYPSLLETPDADWDRVMQVNLRGTFLFCKHAVAAMVAGGGGAIVNLSSISGLRDRKSVV